MLFSISDLPDFDFIKFEVRRESRRAGVVCGYQFRHPGVRTDD